MDLFDGKGFDFHHFQRMQQLHEQKKTNRLLQEAAEEESRQPQCPHCGGRLPGRFDVCVNCNRELHWGREHNPYKSSNDLHKAIAAEKRQLERTAEQLVQAAEAKAHQQAEYQAMLDRHGIIVRFPIFAVGGMLCAVVYAAFAYGQHLYGQNDVDHIASFWRAGAAFCLSVTLVFGVGVAPSILIAVLFIEAACMVYFGMPLWLWATGLVVIVTEMLSLGRAQSPSSADDEDNAELGTGGSAVAAVVSRTQSRELLAEKSQRHRVVRQQAVQDGRITESAARKTRPSSLACPKCKGAIPLPSRSATEINCPLCGGVFRLRRQPKT